ncbi:MAG: TPM domain-containing protein, partial [Acidimicrobiia bacterium]|nr:TPM domain-containing protein [Acidimicrobiia bacterium]
MNPRRTPFIAVFVTLLTLVAAPALALQTDAPADCGVYQGVVCQGWFTDDAGVVDDDARVNSAISSVVATHGNEIAFVVVQNTGSETTAEFAIGIGNGWGVGGPDRDGIVVVVDLDGRWTQIETGEGLQFADASRLASVGNSFFGDGDFDGGVLAIVAAIEAELANPTPPSEGFNGTSAGVAAAVFGLAVLAGGGIAWRAASSRRRSKETSRRANLVDQALSRLEPVGGELPLLEDYAIEHDGTPGQATTAQAIDALTAIEQGRRATSDSTAIDALWRSGVITVVDRATLLESNVVPLELRASSERSLLEDAVQAEARRIADVESDDREVFDVRLAELNRVVDTLRPHRVAAARKRTAEALADGLVETTVGQVAVTDLGERFYRAASVFDPGASLDDSLRELATAYETASGKTATLERLYAKLPAGTTRPAVAAALADVSDEPDEAYREYEAVRVTLEKEGEALEADGLDIPAVAALLLMNHDESDVEEFIEAYQANRSRGQEPGEAVEYALAGLTDASEIDRVRRQADKLGLPVSITVALLRRRDDGPEVYRQLLNELAGHGPTGETLRTIAGILAVSLEPAQAVRRWIEARQALGDLGLEGSYADVAAAFGASDDRGPKRFALSYAAQRQALARSSIDDADRFAPELAHEGTSRQTDT